MFSKVALFIVAVFAAFGVATPISSGKCNSGPVQCCKSLNDAQSPAATDALSQIANIDLNSITGMVGLECNPITGIGAGVGANCASTAVCCEENYFSALVGVNCTPLGVGA